MGRRKKFDTSTIEGLKAKAEHDQTVRHAQNRRYYARHRKRVSTPKNNIRRSLQNVAAIPISPAESLEFANEDSAQQGTVSGIDVHVWRAPTIEAAQPQRDFFMDKVWPDRRSSRSQNPWPSMSPQPPPRFALESSDPRLLSFWFNTTCRLITIEINDNNPLSYSLLPILVRSQALLHLVQSISAGHSVYFQPTEMRRCLEERGKALAFMRNEIRGRVIPPESVLLTIILMGMSSAWISNDEGDYGYEHLCGARSMLNIILHKVQGQRSDLMCYTIGLFVYWDMVCSFLVPSTAQKGPSDEDMFAAIKEISERCTKHPVTGIATEICYIISVIGKYYRRCIESNERDYVLEKCLAEQLRKCQMMDSNDDLMLLAESFRLTGFIVLHSLDARESDAMPSSRELVASYARQTVVLLSRIPLTSARVGSEAWLLVVAGSELSSEEKELRRFVLDRLDALHSQTRLRINLWSLDLVKEVWRLREYGINTSWLQLMLDKGWRLMLA